MTIEQIIREYGIGKSKETMLESVHTISEYIEAQKMKSPEAYESLVKDLYGIIRGEHYNEEFANEQIRKMYFKDDSGTKHFAPYWTEEQMSNAYKVAHEAVPECYNEWDFRVAMNMIYSDNRFLLDEWFPDATDEEMTSKIIDLTINYLCDEDAPHPNTKVWCYFNT